MIVMLSKVQSVKTLVLAVSLDVASGMEMNVQQDYAKCASTCIISRCGPSCKIESIPDTGPGRDNLVRV